jgi:hypothetical protein
MTYPVGTIVDLNDRLFGWRGQYKVIAQKSNFDKVRIENLGTHSKQFVSPDRLRLGKLPQFFIKSMQAL